MGIIHLLYLRIDGYTILFILFLNIAGYLGVSFYYVHVFIMLDK